MIDLNDFEVRRITEIASLERARKGRIYPARSTLIELSAIHDGVAYLEKSGEVETRYCVVIANIDCVPYYLYLSISKAFPEFMYKYGAGINLQQGELKNLKVHVHNIETQAYIAETCVTADRARRAEEAEVERLEDMKKYFLDNMMTG